MRSTAPDPLELARGLIRCPSVTPAEGGALAFLEDLLGPVGYACHRLRFSEEGTPDVDNLFARRGNASPHLCFAGHTDVVPPGDEALWSHPPFAAETHNGLLIGRGACDMKSAITCFAVAALDYAEARGGELPGSISFLITGDEEGPAINGTSKVLDWMAANGHAPDHALVGEPSNPEMLGDAMKVGRRGSLNGRLTINGEQGHVAYPDKADNPIPGLLAVLNALLREPLDEGTEHFQPSNLEVVTIDVGNPADNVIPARATAGFNIRFNDLHDGEGLKAALREKTARALEGTSLTHELELRVSGESFLTAPGALTDALSDAISDVTGRRPELSTGGGTSDARFIKDFCPVVEFGLVNTTIHQIDERTSVEDLYGLTGIYRRFIERYFEVFG